MKKSLITLLLITLLGGFLRFVLLDRLPVSPNWDEISHGYNAYSILKTGKDEWGGTFPLIFRAFGDYKLPLYIYLSVIPVWLFGLSVFSVRFISALAGTLAIPGIFLLTRELLDNNNGKNNEIVIPGLTRNLYKDLPLLSALLLAISPWHFFVSRPALEANLALTLIIFGAYFLLRYVNKKSSLLPSAVLLGLSLHTYNTARVFVPLLIVAAFVIYRSSLRGGTTTQSPRLGNRKNIFAILLFGTLSLIVAVQIFTGVGTARYEKLKILSPSIVYQIGEARANSTLPAIISKIIYNRPVTFTLTAAKNYFGYFSPQFFYQTRGAQSQFAIPGQNLLSLPVYLLAVLGFLVVLINLKKNKSYQLIFAWLLLSPVAASLTADPPQALRPNPMIPALIIMASLGAFLVFEKVSKKYLTIIAIAISVWIVSSFAGYLYEYNSTYKTKYSSAWQYGYPQIMNFIKLHSSEYEKIFITKRLGEPHIFYAFFNRVDPKMLQVGGDNVRFEKSDWFWTDKIGNVYFVNDWQIPTITANQLPLESGGTVSTERSLLITSPDHVPVNAHVIETINYLDGTLAFIITSVP